MGNCQLFLKSDTIWSSLILNIADCNATWFQAYNDKLSKLHDQDLDFVHSSNATCKIALILL